jgi:fatty acid-binding protein DegV
VLNIKPILQMVDGRIEPFDRVRTNQRAIERMVEELRSATGESGRRAIATVAHAERADDCRRMLELVRPYSEGEPSMYEIGPIVGCHAGPGTLALIFHLAS